MRTNYKTLKQQRDLEASERQHEIAITQAHAEKFAQRRAARNALQERHEFEQRNKEVWQ
ncbi:hypothetical protein [Deefgea piscis]|uniref:hypothetical protein n=1 Tax=Deefgea piscis TaxID=2739061 RepID=UPI001C824B3D|nr:hypothetical protein [Deefgea piscis]QZA80264.1 hypothetical protein K4H25_12050 [Deefgea piscis]